MTQRQSAVREFYERWNRRAIPDAVSRARADTLHQILMTATLDVPPAATTVRQPSMALDGTPVMYSLQLPVGAEYPAFRVLCEPGGLGLTVPQQIDHALEATQHLLDRLGWTEAADEINAVTAAVFPADPAPLSSWWGGIWLGASIGIERTELRLYMNLRHGDQRARWQRVADAIRPFADQSLEEPFAALMEQVVPVAIPVGLGIVIHEGRLAALRLYAGMHEPSVQTILQARPPQFTQADEAIAAFCQAFASAYGPFRRQSVTVAYDFIREETGLFAPQIARFKADLSCEGLPEDANPSAAAFLTSQLRRLWPDQETHWNQFWSDLSACFGGGAVRYLSLGARKGLSHVTAYVLPAGFRHE